MLNIYKQLHFHPEVQDSNFNWSSLEVLDINFDYSVLNYVVTISHRTCFCSSKFNILVRLLCCIIHNNKDVIHQYTTFVIAKPQKLLWSFCNKCCISMDYTLIIAFNNFILFYLMKIVQLKSQLYILIHTMN
jgi:hypothetical protein